MRACGMGRSASRSSQQLAEIEVVTLQARIERLAVTAEIDAVELVPEAAEIGPGARRIEEREHRAIELEALVGKVAAGRVVVEHHHLPRAGDEMPPGARPPAPRGGRSQRLPRG